MYEITSYKVIQPPDRLTASSSNYLLHELETCLKRFTKVVILDLKGVKFIDSIGLGILVSMQNRLKKHGGRIYLCTPQRQARYLFEVADVRILFDIFPTYDEFYEEIVKKNRWVLVK